MQISRQEVWTLRAAVEKRLGACVIRWQDLHLQTAASKLDTRGAGEKFKISRGVGMVWQNNSFIYVGF